MNKQYKELFQFVARNGALNAEKAIDVFKKGTEEDHTKDIEVLSNSIATFNDLEDRLKDGKEPSSKDYLMLYTGALVTKELLQKNINTWTAIVKEYDENLIPKLKEVCLETNEEKQKILVEDFFS